MIKTTWNEEAWLDKGQLGYGSFGTVSKIQCKNSKKYAVKKQSCSGVYCDTVREIACYALLMQTTKQLQSPLLFAMELTGKRIVLIMEAARCDLATFSDLLTETERIDLFPRIVKLSIESMLQIHSTKIIHCDIKPTNILVWYAVKPKSRRYRIDRIGLADFGLSSSKPDTGIYVYTNPYRPPEIIENEYFVPDATSDTWALGVSLVDFLFNDMLFNVATVDLENKYKLLDRRAECLYHLPKKLKIVDDETSKLILSMLEYDREKRITFTIRPSTFPVRNWTPRKENKGLQLKSTLVVVWENTWRFGISAFCHAIDIICRYLAKETVMANNLEGICMMAMAIATKWGMHPINNNFITPEYVESICPYYSIVMLKIFEQRIINALRGLIFIPGLEPLVTRLSKLSFSETIDWLKCHFSQLMFR